MIRRAVDMPALWTGRTLPTMPWTARRRAAHMPTAPTATFFFSDRTGKTINQERTSVSVYDKDICNCYGQMLTYSAQQHAAQAHRKPEGQKRPAPP